MKTGKKSFIGRCCFNSPSRYEIGDCCAASQQHSRGGCTWRRATFPVSQVHIFALSRQLRHLNVIPCCLPIQSCDYYLFIDYSLASSLSHSLHLLWRHRQPLRFAFFLAAQTTGCQIFFKKGIVWHSSVCPWVILLCHLSLAFHLICHTGGWKLAPWQRHQDWEDRMILAFSDSLINCFVPMDTHTHTHTENKGFM